MAAIKDNVKELRERAGYSQEELGAKLGKTRSAVSQYESGKIIPRMGVIEELASIFGVSKSEIIGDTPLVLTRDAAAFVDIPLYGSIAAGTPIEMIQIDDTFPIPAKMNEMHPDAFLLKVVGTSMDRVLPDGCYALIDPCTDVEINNAPYAVCVNGNDATIKRVHKLENGFELVPDSSDPTFKSKVYDYGEEGTEKITIIGRVVYHVIPFDWTY